MPKISRALSSISPSVTDALVEFGDNLATARKRRHESRAAWARRLGVSIPTLIRMERGDPGVACGIYATALSLIGQTPALARLADPELDADAATVAPDEDDPTPGPSTEWQVVH